MDSITRETYCYRWFRKKNNTLHRTAPSIAIAPYIILEYIVVFPEPVATLPTPFNQHKFRQLHQLHHSTLLAVLQLLGSQPARQFLVCALSSASCRKKIVTSTCVPVFMEALIISGVLELQSQEVSLSMSNVTNLPGLISILVNEKKGNQGNKCTARRAKNQLKVYKPKK